MRSNSWFSCTVLDNHTVRRLLVGEREKKRLSEMGRERAYTARYTFETMEIIPIKMFIITRSLIELEVNILILAYAVISVVGHKI